MAGNTKRTKVAGELRPNPDDETRLDVFDVPRGIRQTFRFWAERTERTGVEVRMSDETLSRWSALDRERMARVENNRAAVAEELKRLETAVVSGVGNASGSSQVRGLAEASVGDELKMSGELEEGVIRGAHISSRSRVHPPSISKYLNTHPPGRPTYRPSLTFLDTYAAILPVRIGTEVLGDYIEDLNRRAREGQRLGFYLRLASAMFWTGVNAVGYFMKEIGRRKAA